MARFNMIGTAKEEYLHSISSKVSIIFGITLIVYSFMVAHARVRMGVYDAIFVMNILTLILGIVILLDKNRSILSSMGLYSLGMALTRLPTVILFTFWPNPPIAFLAGIFFLVIMINMFYSAWQYLHGICRGYISSTVIILFLWFLYFGLFVATAAGFMPDVTGTVFQRVLDIEILGANVILFTVYLVVLCTDEMHDRCEMEIAYDHIQTFRSFTDAGFDSSISREDAKRIFAGPATWEKVENVGPVESEMRFIVSYTDYALFGTAQKWRNDDRVFFTISESEWGRTMVEATRFYADEIACENGEIGDCTHLVFRQKNGDCFKIEVLDDNVKVIY